MFPSRRTFFQIAGFLLPTLLFSPFGWLRSLVAPHGEVGVLKRPRPNPFVRDGKTLVVLVRGRNVDQMVRTAVSMLGGVEKLHVKGKTVLVKPNVVASDPPPTTTNPAVVGSVVRLLYDAGAGKVLVGDMSALLTLPTVDNLEKTGIANAARQAGADVIDFDDAEWIEVKPPGAWLTRSIHIAKPVYEADLLVNLPVVKTHRNATYSLCLKNMVGVTHPRYRPYRVNPAKWEEVVAELNLAVAPDLNIVDATTSMVAGGPWKGTAEPTNLIIASGDRIAADAAGVALIKHFGKWKPVSEKSVWDQRQIRHAQELGVGVTEPASVEMITKLLEGDEQTFEKLMGQIQTFVHAAA